ncbi:LysM peptidoglycan-binding domain-containing protein [uncultured Microbacterium sp.]|uniref:LysM peptidoglycan-binding domain-containing protein n=1 Tax=uncultured Microbacterium sp. TaxID=191216 RepID=UPI0035CA058C
MTAIAIGRPMRRSRTRTVSAASSATRLRLTVRGRRLLALLAAIPAVIALSLAILGGGAALASRDAGLPADSFQTVTVVSGQSLWSIAEKVAPSADPRDVVDAIMRLNALDSATVSTGQKLAVPGEYGGSH